MVSMPLQLTNNMTYKLRSDLYRSNPYRSNLIALFQMNIVSRSYDYSCDRASIIHTVRRFGK